MALRPRTLAIRAPLCAAAGFLSTVAVAWASAYFYPSPFNASCRAATTAGPVVKLEPDLASPLQGNISRFDTRLASFVAAVSPPFDPCGSLNGTPLWVERHARPCDDWD